MKSDLINVTHNTTLELINAGLAGAFENPISIQENSRLLPPLHFQGVDIFILDESSQMYTGSFKALTAVECIADCIQKDINEICFTSGANTGMAMAAYANRAGIKTYFFVPSNNVWKLDFRYLSSHLSTVCAVKDLEKTKAICEEFAERSDIPLMPKRAHRFRAASIRGITIASLINKGLEIEWFAQTVCAGFGPIGIYNFLSNLKKENHLFLLPRFLGVQQPGSCSLTMYLQSKSPRSAVICDKHATLLIEETMYDQHPETYRTFPLMENVVKMSDGVVITVTDKELIDGLLDAKKKHHIHKHLEDNNMKLTVVTKDKQSPQFVQKAGLLAIAGVMEAVKIGLIPQGDKVLCSFSGGTSVGTFQALPDDRVFQLNPPYELVLKELVNTTKSERGIK